MSDFFEKTKPAYCEADPRLPYVGLVVNADLLEVMLVLRYFPLKSDLVVMSAQYGATVAWRSPCGSELRFVI